MTLDEKYAKTDEIRDKLKKFFTLELLQPFIDNDFNMFILNTIIINKILSPENEAYKIFTDAGISDINEMRNIMVCIFTEDFMCDITDKYTLAYNLQKEEFKNKLTVS